MEWSIGEFIIARVDAFVRFVFLVLWDTMTAFLTPFVLWPALLCVAMLTAVLVSRHLARLRYAIRGDKKKARRA
jgi:hypothetical protein